MLQRAIALSISIFLCCASVDSWAQAGDGYVGIYTDSLGTTACTTVPQMSGTTLYVIAKTAGATTNGITGAEFRVEVTNPTGWFFSYLPPTGSVPLGSLLDMDPGSEEDGSGINLAFPTCQAPDGSGNIRLGTVMVFNASGEGTSLLVKRHSSPSNSDFPCPLFVLCDSPEYSKSCMSPGASEACSLGVAKVSVVAAVGDQPVFAAGLNSPELPTNATPVEPGAVPPEVVGRPTLISTIEDQDRVGLGGEPLPMAAKVLADTVWLADWSFDGGSAPGWTKVDNRDLNNGEIYWSANSRYAGVGGIVNKAAVLRSFKPCWADTGYGNGWDQSLRLNYQGTAAHLSFDAVLQTEPDDGLTIEADEGCRSEYVAADSIPPMWRRRLPSPNEPLVGGGLITRHFDVVLPSTTRPSCVYIRFTSDNAASDEDGLYKPNLNAALVVDNIVVTGDIGYSENFESQTWNANVVPVNSAPNQAFGEWARLCQHVTDNDYCTEDVGHSWMFNDPLRLAFFPNMAFGPGSAVVRNWLDDILISPWVAVPSNYNSGTVLSFREFPGNDFKVGRIMRSWSVRSIPKNSSCRSVWSNDNSKSGQLQGTWDDLSTFTWMTRVKDLSLFVPENADSLQVRFRVSDWQYVFGDPPPATLNPGPGPYIDRVRIGRLVLAGPVISEGEDSRSQAQDAFPDHWTDPSLPGWYLPRHGTCSFSAALDIAPAGSTTTNPGDSIWVSVVDRRGAGGLRVFVYGAIVQGPHKGKAPAPYTVDANGFFKVEADTCRIYGIPRPTLFSVNLDDTYFRGGDKLLYYWYATDNGNGKSSDPPGIAASPASIEDAERMTGGLHEVSFLPAVNWAPSYRARIAADSHGDISPTVAELENSPQQNCILYVNKADTERRSISRTSLMYTLDAIGYGEDTLGVRLYDVYDVRGYGNIHNELMGRCDAQSQAGGYALIIHDAGRLHTGALPDGTDGTVCRQNQDDWYANWLESCGAYNDHGFANLWLIGENLATSTRQTPLLHDRMGVWQPEKWLPDVHQATQVASPTGFQFIQPLGGFAGASFPSLTLNSSCPRPYAYDKSSAVNATVTHRYQPTNDAAIIMHHTSTVWNGYQSYYNTIWTGFPWAAINAPAGSSPARQLAQAILNATVTTNCAIVPHPATDRGDDAVSNVPQYPSLEQNFPNPFNPVTTVKFDLSEDGAVSLRVYDLSGRLVRCLVNADMKAGHHRAMWDGTDDRGTRVSSGVYVYRLVTGGFATSRKMVVLK